MIPLIAAGVMAAGSIAGSAISAHYADKAAQAEREARERAAETLRQQGALSNTEYNNIIGDINRYYAQRGSLGSAQDVNAYKQAIADYNPNDYAADIGDFSYDKTKEDFLNPYYSRIIGDTANSIQHSAAGAGLGRGTGAALNIAKGVSEKSDELYRTAMQDYTQDRNFAYQQYQDRIANNQARLNALNSASQYKIGLQGTLAQDYYNTMDSRQSDYLKAKQDQMSAKSAYDTAIVGLY